MRFPARRSVPLPSLLLPLLLLAAVAAAPGPADAQERGLKGVQLEASGLWTGLVGDAFPFDETGWGGTAGIHHHWPSGLSLGVVGLHARPEDLSLPTGDVRRTMSQWGAFLELRYHLARVSVVRPYIGARAGGVRFDDEQGTTGNGLGYGLTAGTEIWPSDRFAFRVAASGGGLTVFDFLQEGESASGGQWTVEAGVSVFTGSVRRVSDADQDGVRDAVDDCPGTPAGVEVDRRGCAIDADRDGIADYQDRCTGTMAGARVDESGCARDPDGDGIPEGLDECPDTPRGVEVDNEGCALDRDGDGVSDDRDACPGTPEGVAVDDEGCARDSDGDGVHDGTDECPDTPEGREVDEEGCTEIEAGIERGRLTLSNIHFAFASAQLTEDSRQILDQVGEALVARPDVRVQIQGHTDSIGSDQANLRISRARARAVRLYLVSEFPAIGADRLEAVGRGENEPVATNGTAEGRSRNRRVEFVVLDEEDGGA